MKLKIGDKVKVVSEPDLRRVDNNENIIGKQGTVKDFTETRVGVEFDENVGGHNGSWGGKNGHCWYVRDECLEKIEETEEETKEENEKTKAETFDQKILEVLREEIGVEVGEEFGLYKNGEKQLTGKFERSEFFYKLDDEPYKHGDWEYIACNFHECTFKRKPFIPECGEDYFFLVVDRNGNKNIKFRVLQDTWIDGNMDYGRLALENVFRSEKTALKNKDKLLKKREKLRKGEV